jgi:hypothetical protein
MNEAMWCQAWYVQFLGLFAKEVSEVVGFGACLLSRSRWYAGVKLELG